MKVSNEIINSIYDATVLMRFLSQRLGEGEVSDNEASEMAWLLGSAKLRLEPVIGLLEREQLRQDRREPGPEDAVLEIGAEVLAIMEKFRRNRKGASA